MKRCDWESLKDFILLKNNYFTSGFANAYKDVESNAIYSRTESGLKVVFPQDTFGNYFYLRNEPATAFRAKPGYEDCGTGRVMFDQTNTLYLVAMVNDADESLLIENLANTCMSYKQMSVIPVSAIWLRENVVLTEMSGFDKEEIFMTLTRLKKQTIVRVQLQAAKEFIPNNCINDPCKECK